MVSVPVRDAPDIRPDNPAFFISGIRPDIYRIALPDIQQDWIPDIRQDKKLAHKLISLLDHALFYVCRSL
jgi:hypothetical protein